MSFAHGLFLSCIAGFAGAMCGNTAVQSIGIGLALTLLVCLVDAICDALKTR